jgi:Cu(I)/Ag(I) efflux system membrane fusion protein
MKYYLWILLFVIGFWSSPLVFEQAGLHAAESQAVKGDYYCPMHPNYTSDRPGKCPICGMDLVKKKADPLQPKERKVKFYRNPMDPTVTSPVPMKDGMGMDYVPVYEEGVSGVKGVAINTDQQQLIGVKTEKVIKRALFVQVRAAARVVLDKELYDAQAEYLSSSVFSSRIFNSARQKLVFMGMGEKEIDGIKRARRADKSLIDLDYSDDMWVYASIYENDMMLVKPGQPVELTPLGSSGTKVKGVVTGVARAVDPQSRTVRVRILAKDKEKRFHPEMFMTAVIAVDLGEKLSVPVPAVLDSGLRKVVYVIKDDRFEQREVVLGPKAGDFYEVTSGLQEGEIVATSGNFLIDAESKLKGSN